MGGRMDAVVTAGGRIAGRFAEEAGVAVKALIEVSGRPVICTVAQALRGVPEIERILVIGPDELRRSPVAELVDEIVPEAAGGAENFLMGLERCSPGGRAVFAASDLPFLSAEAVRTYLGMCPEDAHFCYPVLTKNQFQRAYPGSDAKFAPLKGGTYTGGCVFLVDPEAILASRPLVERVFAARKSLFRLASILGWGFILRLVTRTVGVGDCVRRGSEIIGCNCQAILDSPAELAYDLDDLDDYLYALRHAERPHA